MIYLLCILVALETGTNCFVIGTRQVFGLYHIGVSCIILCVKEHAYWMEGGLEILDGSDEFKAFFRSTDPGIQFNDEPEEVPEIEPVKLLEGEELDSLAGEVGIKRQDGESDIDFRERVALTALEKDLQKTLEIMLAKRKEDWHPDEELLLETFTKKEADETKKFISDYIHREEVSKENKETAIQNHVMFPQFCVLSNELRNVMSWFLGTVAPWDRDPCFGCSHCMMGKHPEENNPS